MRSLRTLVSLSVCCVVIFITSGGCFAQPVMFAHYINMGQADATLLEFPCGAILIDASRHEIRGFFPRRPPTTLSLAAPVLG